MFRYFIAKPCIIIAGKMKMMLLSNTTKPGKGEKPVGKTNESKTSAKKNLHCNFYNKNNHEKQIY